MDEKYLQSLGLKERVYLKIALKNVNNELL